MSKYKDLAEEWINNDAQEFPRFHLKKFPRFNLKTIEYGDALVKSFASYLDSLENLECVPGIAFNHCVGELPKSERPVEKIEEIEMLESHTWQAEPRIKVLAFESGKQILNKVNALISLVNKHEVELSKIKQQ